MDGELKFNLTKEQQEDIQNIIVQQITLIIPSLIEKIAPTILLKTKELTKNIWKIITFVTKKVLVKLKRVILSNRNEARGIKL